MGGYLGRTGKDNRKCVPFSHGSGLQNGETGLRQIAGNLDEFFLDLGYVRKVFHVAYNTQQK